MSYRLCVATVVTKPYNRISMQVHSQKCIKHLGRPVGATVSRVSRLFILLTCLQAAREVDDAHHSAAKAEAEASGLRAALDAARTRHFEQLTKWVRLTCHLHFTVKSAGQSLRADAVCHHACGNIACMAT